MKVFTYRGLIMKLKPLHEIKAEKRQAMVDFAMEQIMSRFTTKEVQDYFLNYLLTANEKVKPSTKMN